MQTELRGTARPGDGAPVIAIALAPADQHLCGTGRGLAQPRPLSLLPALELSRFGNEEAGEQVALVELERFLELLGRGGVVERGDITPEALRVQPDVLITAGDDGVRAQRTAQD